MNLKEYYLSLFDLREQPIFELPDTEMKINPKIIAFDEYAVYYLIQSQHSQDGTICYNISTFNMLLAEFSMTTLDFKVGMFLR
jgi:hypothetical protein